MEILFDKEMLVLVIHFICTLYDDSYFVKMMICLEMYLQEEISDFTLVNWVVVIFPISNSYL